MAMTLQIKYVTLFSRTFFGITGVHPKRTSAENSALLGYYAESSGNFLPTFRDNLSVPSSTVSVPKRRQEITATRCIITKKRAVLIYFAAEV
jgi:hypothetical protein